MIIMVKLINEVNMQETTRIAIFKGKEIRKTIHKNEWWFVIVDVVSALTDSVQPDGYIKDMRANTEGIFRIIQSIPSPKAEPFKRWLARVGYERVQEIEDPELATKRTRALYKAKGYPDAWIEKRMRGIEIRETLTDEWKKRQVGKDKDYAILTAEISKATFGMTPSEYKKFKSLNMTGESLRSNDLELIFSMLGEASTTEITKNKDTQGFSQSKKAAQEGGAVAGNARRELEQKSGKKVSSKENYVLLKDRQRLKAK
ncbi:MAG: Prophage antirepressor [candidate division WWE3 bacterium GW2011_GWB1_44_4]|uniref:Prophage antirepressor n=1 Tax=candidate division WWE3 bacterium GW2011_GWB1_44_4 TaxID=1619116 RepID=A0A0G1MCU6_UNCKA|nr:MAG: Prophage antirepressor [candidate division WWE3 bacterium GW2011_GWB1_44_4]